MISRDDPESARDRLRRELQALQKESGMTLKELESKVHASDSSLSCYLSGRAVPPWPVVERLALLGGAEPGTLRRLWESAGGGRRSIRLAARPTASSASPTKRPDAQPATAVPGRTAGTTSAPWRRHLFLVIAAAVVPTAALFGGLGVLVGAHFFSRVSVRRVAPTQAEACETWMWPPAAGEDVQPPARPHGIDHTPVVQLMTGTVHGRPAVWARITHARYGDRVWVDWTTNRGKTWTQCGPFPVTSDVGVTKAGIAGPHLKFRACGDVPQPAENSPRDACTNFW